MPDTLSTSSSFSLGSLSPSSFAGGTQASGGLGGANQRDRALFAGDSENDSTRGTPRFAAILGRSQNTEDLTPQEKARGAAQQFVAIALVQPILKQIRETNQAAPPFAPTGGEKQFQGLFDTEIAQRIVRAAHFPLVDRLAGDLLRKGGETSTLEVTG